MGRLIEVDVDELKDLLNNSEIELTNNIMSVVRENYIPKDQYETRLKADMVAMLEELKLEIAELKSYESVDGQDLAMLADIGILFDHKINALKGEKNGKEN